MRADVARPGLQVQDEGEGEGEGEAGETATATERRRRRRTERERRGETRAPGGREYLPRAQTAPRYELAVTGSSSMMVLMQEAARQAQQADSDSDCARMQEAATQALLSLCSRKPALGSTRSRNEVSIVTRSQQDDMKFVLVLVSRLSSYPCEKSRW